MNKATEELIQLNFQIRESEKKASKSRKDLEILNTLLSDDLVFRRANGLVVSKADYLGSFDGRTYSKLEITNINIDFFPDESTAFVSLKVDAEITTTTDGKQNTTSGSWINNRFFRLEKGRWRLYAWHNHDAKTGLEKKQLFTGLVWIQNLEPVSNQKNSRCRNVFFEANARTYWHIHTGVQQLIVTAGIAEVVLKEDGKEDRKLLKAGEHIIISPGVLHWHGATKHSFMVHIALNNANFVGEESTTFWFNEVG